MRCLPVYLSTLCSSRRFPVSQRICTTPMRRGSPIGLLRTRAAEKDGKTADYFSLSQINVRTVFLPLAGSFEGWVTRVRWPASNL